MFTCTNGARYQVDQSTLPVQVPILLPWSCSGPADAGSDGRQACLITLSYHEAPDALLLNRFAGEAFKVLKCFSVMLIGVGQLILGEETGVHGLFGFPN